MKPITDGKKFIVYPLYTLVIWAVCIVMSYYTCSTVKFLLCIPFSLVLILLSQSDIVYTKIPNTYVVIELVITILFMVLTNELSLYERIMGFVAITVVLFIIKLISKSAIGYGDIKLMMVAGLLLGVRILFAYGIAAIFATIWIVIRVTFRMVKTKSKVWMGPFLSLGIWFALLSLGF